MRIAFFNWRDIRHPSAGGAEVYVHRLMGCLADLGHEATLYCSTYRGAPERSQIDGIEHIRYGGKFAIFSNAFLCYRRHIRGRADLIVESINGVPFFTPLFARERVVSIIHQLTRENWYSALPCPLAFAGYHLEDTMLSPYRGLTAFAPSPSTRDDLKALGFRDIRLLFGAADAVASGPEKEKTPTIIYLGRLTKSKRVGHAIAAFGEISARVPGARLWICGSGPESGALRKQVRELGLVDSVVFFGRVDEGEKSGLISRAHLMLFPAVREGWGLTVLEANACGTPVVGYDVPGLRDSIRGGVNGVLVPGGDAHAMAEAAIGLLDDGRRLGALSSSSVEYASGFSWKKTAQDFLSSLEGPRNPI